MARKFAFVLTLILALLFVCGAKSANDTQAPHVDVDHEFVSLLKAIFADKEPAEHIPIPAPDAPVSDFIENPGNGVDSVKYPPKWPEMRACSCTCEKDCNQFVCCQAKLLLINITLELRAIQKSLDVKANTTAITVVVEDQDCSPVKIYATASLDIGNNTISCGLVEELGRGSDVKSRESSEPTRREYILLDVLLGPDRKVFRNQVFFVIAPEYNYANEDMVIGKNLLEEAGAGKLEKEFTGHVVEGLRVLAAPLREL